MIPHHSNIYQALECFAGGLAVIAAFALMFTVLYFIGKRFERPVEAWFLRHPLASKLTVRGGWVLVVCIVASGIFMLGCSILEACR